MAAAAKVMAVIVAARRRRRVKRPESRRSKSRPVGAAETAVSTSTRSRTTRMVTGVGGRRGMVTGSAGSASRATRVGPAFYASGQSCHRWQAGRDSREGGQEASMLGLGRPPQALAALVRVKAGSEAMLSGYASHARRRVANRQGAKTGGPTFGNGVFLTLCLGKKVRGAQGLFWRGVVTVERIHHRSPRSVRRSVAEVGSRQDQARTSQSTQ